VVGVAYPEFSGRLAWKSRSVNRTYFGLLSNSQKFRLDILTNQKCLIHNILIAVSYETGKSVAKKILRICLKVVRAVFPL